MKYPLILMLSIFLCFAFTKERDYWKTLSKIYFDYSFDEQGNVIDYRYVFHPKIHKLEGKVIRLKGFVWTEVDKPLILSKFSYPPSSHCTLYDNVDIDTHVQLEHSSPIIYKFNKPYVVEGTFHLEEKDPNERFFKLTVQSMREIAF